MWEKNKTRNKQTKKHHEPRKKLITSDIFTAWFWMFIPNTLSDLQNWLLWIHKPTMLNTLYHSPAILGNILAIIQTIFSECIVLCGSSRSHHHRGSNEKIRVPRRPFSVLVYNIFKTFGFLGSSMSYFSSLNLYIFSDWVKILLVLYKHIHRQQICSDIFKEIFKKLVTETALGQIGLHFTETLVNDNTCHFPEISFIGCLSWGLPRRAM